MMASVIMSNIMFILLLSLDLIILELVSLVVPGIHDEGEVGLYAAALVVAKLFCTVQSVCFSLIASLIASLHEETGGDEKINQFSPRVVISYGPMFGIVGAVVLERKFLLLRA